MAHVTLDETIAHGQASIKKGSKSFAMASLIFAPDMRGDVSMLYAWCRHCDDVIDGQIMGHGQVENYRSGQTLRLEDLTAQTHAALIGEPTSDPIFAGLARVFKKYDIPHRHADELLRGFQMDAEERTYQSLDDILEYCYHVAGVVGVMMAHIMGVRDQATLDRASDLGLGFQLTNISRDVIDDAKAGRVYLPLNLLEESRAPTDAAEIAKRKNWQNVYKSTRPLLDVADAYYASANVGIKSLPFRCAWAISAASKVYREIGGKLHADGPEAWSSRIHTSKGRKTWLALSSVLPALARRRVRVTARKNLYVRPLS